MATYLPGLTDYIPQIQPWKPNYNFYGTVLNTLQTKYDAGYDQLSKMYGELLNSPLLKDENIDRRNEYFKKAESAINQIAGLDLSKESNVRAASNIFQPLIEDEYIMKDMAYTKVYQNERQRGQNLINCMDPEKCGGMKYWEEGVQYLDYQADDFKNSSMEDSLNFSNPRYISDVDVFDRAMKLAKEMDLNVQAPPRGSKDGKWIITDTNGEVVAPYLKAAFYKSLGSDQAVQDKYKVQANLSRRRYNDSLDEPGMGNQEFVNYVSKQYDDFYKKEDEIITQEKQIADAKQKALKEQNQKKEREGSTNAVWTELFSKENAKYENHKDQLDTYQKSLTELNEASKRFGINESNAEAKYAQLLMDSDFGDFATILSQKGAKREMEANPYGLKDYDFGIWKQKNSIENEQDIAKLKLTKDLELRNKALSEGKNVGAGIYDFGNGTYYDTKNNKLVVNPDFMGPQPADLSDYFTTPEETPEQLAANILNQQRQLVDQKGEINSSKEAYTKTLLNTLNQQKFGEETNNALLLQTKTAFSQHGHDVSNMSISELNNYYNNLTEFQKQTISNDLFEMSSKGVFKVGNTDLNNITDLRNLFNSTSTSEQSLSKIEKSMGTARSNALSGIKNPTASKTYFRDQLIHPLKQLILDNPTLNKDQLIELIKTQGLSYKDNPKYLRDYVKQNMDYYNSVGKNDMVPLNVAFSDLWNFITGEKSVESTEITSDQIDNILEEVGFGEMYDTYITNLNSQLSSDVGPFKDYVGQFGGSLVSADIKGELSDNFSKQSSQLLSHVADYTKLKDGDQIQIEGTTYDYNKGELYLEEEKVNNQDTKAFSLFKRNLITPDKSRNGSIYYENFADGNVNKSSLKIAGWSADKDESKIINEDVEIGYGKKSMFSFKIIKNEDENKPSMFRSNMNGKHNIIADDTYTLKTVDPEINSYIEVDNANNQYKLNFDPINVTIIEENISGQPVQRDLKLNASNINNFLNTYGYDYELPVVHNISSVKSFQEYSMVTNSALNRLIEELHNETFDITK